MIFGSQEREGRAMRSFSGLQCVKIRGVEDGLAEQENL
jgi:hypothetical protein